MAFSIAFFIAIAVLFPLGILVYARKKLSISLKPVIVGAVLWIIATQIFEKILHLAVLSLTPLMHFPVWFAIYGSIVAGYEVDTTVDGETIYKMEKEYPDMLLLDIWMAGEDGRDICKYLKKNPLTQHIPVVMISASRDIEESAKEAGADGFIAKPFEMDGLLNVISKYLDASD